MFSQVSIIISQSRTMPTVGRQKEQTNRLYGAGRHNHNVGSVLCFLVTIMGLTHQSFGSPGFIQHNSSDRDVFVHLTETTLQSAPEVIVGRVANADRTDPTTSEILASRSLFVSSPGPRLRCGVENDAMLVEPFSNDFIVIAEFKRG
jgi:hypothetical protein